jgi:hypothetical protein
VEEGEAPDPAEILHWSAVAGERDKLAQVVGHPEVELDGTDERGYSAYRLRKAAHPPTHILGLTAGPLPDPCRRVFAASVIAARTSRYHHACGNGHADCVRVLLDAGCDTSKRNVVGLTGWALAARLKKASVTALLEEHAADGHVALAAEKSGNGAGGGAAAAAAAEGTSGAAAAAAKPAAADWTVKIGAADDDGTGKFTVYRLRDTSSATVRALG